MSKVRSITPLPPADFTPEPGNYKTLQPFRYWCQKVLPLAYDDSLTYYELLCKVVDYLNKTMEDVETLHGDVTNLHTAYEQLQNYVNTYFSNLDVQEEINNKLDSLVNDGTLTDIVEKIIGAQAFPIFVNSIEEMVQHGRIYVLTTNGHIYQYNGSEFIDTNVAYTQAKNVLMYGAFYSKNFDFNSVAFNTYNTVAIQGDPNPTNAPAPFYNGLLICYGGELDTNRGAKQVYIDVKGNMFNRTFNGTNWIDWATEEKKDYFKFGKYYSSDFDFNDVEFNTYNTVSIPGSPNPTNAPSPFYNGLLICYSGEEETNRGAKQVYTDVKGNMYNRTYSGSYWTDWVCPEAQSYFKFGKYYSSDFDFNDVEFNTYNTVSIPGSPNPTNAPSPFYNGLVICYRGEDKTNRGAKQVYTDTKGNVYNRTYSGSYWTDWVKSVNTYYVSNVNELVEVIPKCKYDTIVYVSGGNYDLSEYATSTGYGMTFTGTWIGLSSPKLFINLTTPSNLHSVINAPRDYLYMDGFIIENTNGRYCIHDEMNGTSLNGGTHIYKNCKLIHNSSESELWKAPRCFGCGLGSGVNILLENVHFKSIIDTPCDIHSDGKVQTTFCSVRIKNCYFENGTVTLRETGTGATKELLHIECSGNLLHSDIVDSSNVFNLIKWNNEII